MTLNTLHKVDYHVGIVKKFINVITTSLNIKIRPIILCIKKLMCVLKAATTKMKKTPRINDVQ